jgi:pyroglutamyl-peptidase
VTVLVTGFEPFGGSDVNASQLLVSALAQAREPGLVAAVLPTSYRRAEARIVDLIRSHRPTAILLTGLAPEAPGIRFEEVALNLDNHDAPDNDGEVRRRRRIVETAPVGYWNTLPLDAMAGTAGSLSEDVAFSHDAGGYVCNHVFFTARHVVATEQPTVRCGFVHLPAVQGHGERLGRLVKVVRAWIGLPEIKARE